MFRHHDTWFTKLLSLEIHSEALSPEVLNSIKLLKKTHIDNNKRKTCKPHFIDLN